MSKEQSKYQEWRHEIICKKFSSEKKIIEYMAERPAECWIRINEFSDRAFAIFGELALEDGRFYRNNSEQFIDKDSRYLFNASFEEFVDNFNLPDFDGAPVLKDFFKSFENDPEAVSGLLSAAYRSLNVVEINKKDDIKILNQWVEREVREHIKPAFYTEEIYAYLIIVVGELLKKTKLKGACWGIHKTRIDNIYTRYIYVPYLVDGKGVRYDLLDSFRQNLFLSGKRMSISKVFNGITEFEPVNNPM